VQVVWAQVLGRLLQQHHGSAVGGASTTSGLEPHWEQLLVEQLGWALEPA